MEGPFVHTMLTCNITPCEPVHQLSSYPKQFMVSSAKPGEPSHTVHTNFGAKWEQLLSLTGFQLSARQWQWNQIRSTDVGRIGLLKANLFRIIGLLCTVPT